MTEAKIYELLLPYPETGDRLVRVYVPSREEGETFPVIYMTDGQNLFENKPESFGCWYTREAVEAERKLSGRAAIIVGIHNDLGPMQRTNELTPKSIGAPKFPSDMPLELKKMFSPSGEVFDDFVMDIVKPAVEEKFPVKKGREYTAFCGSSSGGLQAFFTALSHPDSFSIAGVFSPAFLLYSEEDLRAWIYSKLGENLPYLYIYTGAGDELEKEIYQGVEFVYDTLLECYPMQMLNEVVLLENRHNEKAWEEIFKDFLHTFLNF